MADKIISSVPSSSLGTTGLLLYCVKLRYQKQQFASWLVSLLCLVFFVWAMALSPEVHSLLVGAEAAVVVVVVVVLSHTHRHTHTVGPWTSWPAVSEFVFFSLPLQYKPITKPCLMQLRGMSILCSDWLRRTAWEHRVHSTYRDSN